MNIQETIDAANDEAIAFGRANGVFDRRGSIEFGTYADDREYGYLSGVADGLERAKKIIRSRLQNMQDSLQKRQDELERGFNDPHTEFRDGDDNEHDEVFENICLLEEIIEGLGRA